MVAGRAPGDRSARKKMPEYMTPADQRSILYRSFVPPLRNHYFGRQ
jgi:hypothetical protein